MNGTLKEGIVLCGLYPFGSFKMLSLQAINSEPASLSMSDFAGHIYYWFAIAHQENINHLIVLNGYNPTR